MFVNVWGFIWPNQKIALGIKEGYDADAKAKAAKEAADAAEAARIAEQQLSRKVSPYGNAWKLA